ncbi:MAG: Fe-S cluster assembly scaffold IscU [Enterobacteriaceae bacterium]
MSYSKMVLDHYENPRNVGSLDSKNKNVGSSMVGSPSCGDVIKLQIKIDNNNIIEDAKFKTYGCGSAIASSSLLTEMIKGKTINQIKKIKNITIAKKLLLPPIKFHCSILAEKAIKEAIKNYYIKNNL